MKFRAFLCILLTGLYSPNAFSIIKTINTPSWVESYLYTFEQEDVKYAQDGNVFLLSVYVVNLDRKESYFRAVVKITNENGLPSASTITHQYDPSYQ